MYTFYFQFYFYFQFQDTIAFLSIMILIASAYSIIHYSIMYMGNDDFSFTLMERMFQQGFWLLFGELLLEDISCKYYALWHRSTVSYTHNVDLICWCGPSLPKQFIIEMFLNVKRIWKWIWNEYETEAYRSRLKKGSKYMDTKITLSPYYMSKLRSFYWI
jgi:hypothetical protein